MNRNRIARNDFKGGFTLVEVLLVIAIIGILATVLVVTIGGTPDAAKKDTTEIQIKQIAGALEKFAARIGRYPTDSEGLQALLTAPQFEDESLAEKWSGPYLQPEQLKDPWNNDINYEVADAGSDFAGGKKYKLTSNGPDGTANSEDDISNITENQDG